MCEFGVQFLNTGKSGFFEIMTIRFQLRRHCVTEKLQKDDKRPGCRGADYIKKSIKVL
ncbi:MAG: hypothetical protein K0Q78_912 [Cellvibrio sp.]|nr:hypothetical protein [Cellvibrio sp.]